jgi:hypothetical protein
MNTLCFAGTYSARKQQVERRGCTQRRILRGNEMLQSTKRNITGSVCTQREQQQQTLRALEDTAFPTPLAKDMNAAPRNRVGIMCASGGRRGVWRRKMTSVCMRVGVCVDEWSVGKECVRVCVACAHTSMQTGCGRGRHPEEECEQWSWWARYGLLDE